MDRTERGGGSGNQRRGLGGVSRGIEGPEPPRRAGVDRAVFGLAGGGGGGGVLWKGSARVAATRSAGGQQRSLDCLHGASAGCGFADTKRGGDDEGTRTAGYGILIGRYWDRTSDLLRVKQALYR